MNERIHQPDVNKHLKFVIISVCSNKYEMKKIDDIYLLIMRKFVYYKKNEYIFRSITFT